MSTNNVESIPSSECIHILNSLDNIVFGLEESNISDSIESTIKLINLFFPYSFNYALSRILLISFISQRKDFKVYIDYIKSIEAKEEEFQIDASNRLINVFTNYLIPKQTQESFYIIEQLIKNHLVEPDVTNKIQSFYFVHRKQNLGKPVRATSYIEEDFVNGYDDLSKNDWELHKKYIEEGHAPNELARVIRNDDIEKFQEIVTQSNFDLNQFIKPSLYERYSFINQSKVPLIDYAAYFGAVKCFKYLLANGAKLQSIKYAIAGGNIEIIHLCEQNHTSFKDATETALEFHQNEIVNYISDNQLETITNLTYLGLKCIQYDNYEYLSILENENMEINNMIINESARTGNALLVMHFIEGKEIPKNFMFFSIESLNVEFMKFILNQKGFDVNMRDIYLIVLMFIKLIFSFKNVFGIYLFNLEHH